MAVISSDGCIVVQHCEPSSLEAASAQARKTGRAWQELGRGGPSGPAPLPPEKLLALKPLARKGIPFDARPAAWHVLSGAAARQRAAPPHHYASLAAAPAAPELLAAIEDDLHPGAFPLRATHPLFQSPYGLAALQRLLRAWAAHNPAAGHFRGLACIAGFMLAVMGAAREQEAFWTLAALLEDRMFNYCHGQGGLGARVEAALLGELLPRKLPRVAAHLALLDTHVGALAQGWFATLFTTLLPAETTARVWDALLLEGHKVAQRAALAVLRAFEPAVTSSSNPLQLRKVLAARGSLLQDADALLATAFKGIGAMAGAQIGALRAAAHAEVEQQAAARQQALALLAGCRVT